MNMGNFAMQHQGILAWDGAAPASIDIRRHVGWSFTFEVMNNLAADTVFNVESAPPSAADPCIADVFVPVEEILTCMSTWGAVPLPQATITLPAGAVAGSICTAALPCKPDAFVRINGASGDIASVRAVAILSGPK
jgi:hypothetical protein